jgi:hypothetical protein
MTTIFRPLFFLLLLGSVEVLAQSDITSVRKLSDAPADSLQHAVNLPTISYEAALEKWKSVSDVNDWIKGHFSYSLERAKQLAENSPGREKTAIYLPAELYQSGKGVCIDVSRFAVETMRAIDPSSDINYLLIEFEPINIDGFIIKKHWLAVSKDTAGYHVFADSKRPGYIAGPYQQLEDFIAAYQLFRERKIISWKLLPGYQKRKKAVNAATKADA